MNIPLVSEFIKNLIDGAKVNPAFTAGLLILAVVFIALAIQGLGRHE